MFRHSMFGVFEVRYFGVRSKTSRYLGKYVSEIKMKLVFLAELFPAVKYFHLPICHFHCSCILPSRFNVDFQHQQVQSLSMQAEIRCEKSTSRKIISICLTNASMRVYSENMPSPNNKEIISCQGCNMNFEQNIIEIITIKRHGK